ncbi:hypothetical protein GPALN_016376 [Globodera pallida]|nr:hypothetical protein GPALN_016376 [Globodera pallida]
MDQTQVIATQRQKPKLLHEGMLYVRHKLRRLHTDHNNAPLRVLGEHTCSSSAARVERLRIVSNIRKRALNTGEDAATIRAQELMNVSDTVLAAMPSKSATKKLIQRARHEICEAPPVPNELSQLEIPKAYQFYKHSEDNEEQFLLADSGVYKEEGITADQRILVFGRASAAEWCDQMQHIYADGTFSISQPFFTQLYVFLSRHGEWVFPVCYVLLTTKTQTTYERMFDLLQRCWPTFKPRTASIDCEQAMVGALMDRHPQCSIHFGLFHVVRSMKKQLAEQNLLQMYKTDAVFAETARTITSLAFVPVEDLMPALAALESYLPDPLQGVLDWFVINYVGRPRFDGSRSQPTFPPEEWSVHQRVLESIDWSNNYIITFHRRLQGRLATGCISQTLWRFIDMVRKEQKVVDAEFARFVAGEEPPSRPRKNLNADERILRLVQSYVAINSPPAPNAHQYAARPAQNPSNIIEFLIAMSRNYGAEL